MDVARPASVVRNRKIKRFALAVLILLVAGAMTLGLSKMKPAAPSVDRATVWTDTVKRGPMLREVRGLGTLVPEEVRWIPAMRDGLVERIKARPGDSVGSDTVLLELSNPELEQQVVDAELQVRAAEADLVNTRAQLQRDVLNQQVTQNNVATAYQQAKLDANADAEMAAKGLISAITMKKSAFTADALNAQNEMEKKRIEIYSKSAEAQIAASQARID